MHGGDTIRVRCQGIVAATGLDGGVFPRDRAAFVCGPGARGLLQPALSRACLGLTVGQSAKFVVCPGDPSHPQSARDPSLVVTFPLGTRKKDDDDNNDESPPLPAIGATVRVQHQGIPRLATVTAVDTAARTVTVDMNDPLAGKELHFTVVIEAFDAIGDRLQALFPDPLPGEVPNRTFTRAELRRHDGRNGAAIYVAVNDLVHDMSSGARFYGPGASYGFLAGRDATVALAKFSLDPQVLDDTPEWRLEDFDEGELASLANYMRRFKEKYPIVGRLKR